MIRCSVVRSSPNELIMKRCPQCKRNYYDETLLYCLDLLKAGFSELADEP